jgi:hypothetical protein
MCRISDKQQNQTIDSNSPRLHFRQHEGRFQCPGCPKIPYKRKEEVMRSKLLTLLAALLIAGTSNAAFARGGHMGGAGLRAFDTGPAISSGFHPNYGFGSSSAGGSGGIATGPTAPGSFAVSGMNLSGTGVGAR